jgi:UDP-N-acetylmuramoyl-L-alanyl-D-glutamate--2,6-diaminopimelate ligase
MGRIASKPLRDVVGDDGRYPARFATLPITGLTADSRQVGQGSLFVAIPGTKADGLRYVNDATAKGAAAVMGEQAPSALPDHVAFVQVADARRALALAAARFHARQPGTIAAVTGTSGKTSVAAFTRQIWERRSAIRPRASARSASYRRAAKPMAR